MINTVEEPHRLVSSVMLKIKQSLFMIQKKGRRLLGYYEQKELEQNYLKPK